VTLIWFVIWLIFNLVGDKEPLVLDPVNVWAATLILALALDLGRQHASDLGAPSKRDRRRTVPTGTDSPT
jgi:hypothetical protein